jgi:hypothetical protein
MTWSAPIKLEAADRRRLGVMLITSYAPATK